MNTANLFFKLQFPILLLFMTVHTVSAKLIVIENATHLDSGHEDIGYPKNNETLDVLWVFSHSVRLRLNKFHLNGHSGDFVLISDLPLLNDFKNTSGQSYVDLLANSIVTDQGILLSWKVNKTFEVISDQGTFLLFHAEFKEPSWQAEFEGFDIDIINYDDTVTTTTARPTDSYLTPPNDEETYITKFLDCKPPQQFLRELDDFKDKIAQLATSYCKESKIPECLDRGNITQNEVNIPDAKEGIYAGLHYCDLSWPNRDTCVQVTFSITRVDSNGKYVLPTNQLEKMWATKSHELEKHRYCPYSPPESLVDLNTLVWIAFFLGIMLSLTGLLALAWVMNTRAVLEYRRSFMRDSKDKGKKISNDDPQEIKHYSADDPIYKILRKTANRDDHDHLYHPSSDYLHVEDNNMENNPTASPFKKRSTENPTYEDAQADVYAYDNSGYEMEENPGPLPTLRTEETKVFMRPRTSHSSLSDTEI